MTRRDATHYYTSKHRPVYGGGGISPDVYVPYDTGRLSGGLLGLIFSDELRSVLWDHFIHNRAAFNYKTVQEYESHFNDEDKILKNYLASLKGEDKVKAVKILSSYPQVIARDKY